VCTIYSSGSATVTIERQRERERERERDGSTMSLQRFRILLCGKYKYFGSIHTFGKSLASTANV
jgi:hypothetical protein